MKYTIRFNRFRLPVLVLVVLALAAPSLAADVTIDLCATTGSVTMPDTTVVPIWGYVPGASCAAGAATLPNPVIRVASGDSLTINLTNNLSEPVSFFVPGLMSIPSGGTAGKFTAEADPGGTATYVFDLTNRSGTFLFHSATDRIRTQVPMGLYGALVVDQAPGMAYADVSYFDDQVLVFSEIDPALNADPAGYGGARVINWNPQYFLINGEAYDPATPPTGIGTNQDILLRFVNAGLRTVVPTIGGGLYMNLVGEDGNRYPQPIWQYGIELQAGKTIDAVVNAGADGDYAVYDRALHLVNGGMVTVLQAGAVGGTPTAVSDSYSVDEDGTLTADGVAPNPAGVLANDTGGALAAVLVSGPSSGALSLASDGSFTYTPNSDFFGADQFSYAANDGGGGPNSAPAVVSITVNGLPDAPVAAADSYEAIEGQILNVAAPGVLGNDSDPDGDALNAQNWTTPALGSLTGYGDGGFDFDATGLTAGDVATFDYDACDPGPLCSTATVTVTVIAPPPPPDNIPPVANDDTTSSARGTTLSNYDIVANDTDSDGTIDATSVVITTGSTTQAGGTVINNGNGTITYTPRNNGYRGTDTFQYTVNDDVGATSNVATVRINVQ
ncbi:Ig-like domain-containing protein [Desulfosarcina ovata]|nr:Ig-like domain-containing protein [Desulfosarcina ovata]